MENVYSVYRDSKITLIRECVWKQTRMEIKSDKWESKANNATKRAVLHKSPVPFNKRNRTKVIKSKLNVRIRWQ